MTIRIVRDRYCKFYVRKRSPEMKQYVKGFCVCPPNNPFSRIRVLKSSDTFYSVYYLV